MPTSEAKQDSSPSFQQEYPGTELEIFKDALNWKRYWSRMFASYGRGRAAEVGAGVGANFDLLDSPQITQWCLIEPDQKLFDELSLRHKDKLGKVGLFRSTLKNFTRNNADRFDTIYYIDVLEHIEDDLGELKDAANSISDTGHICILVPAHQYLWSPFDSSVGHVRRYERSDFIRLAEQAELKIIFMRELDSAGAFLSMINRLILRKDNPSASDIWIWDRLVIPVSRIVDRLHAFRFGKSIALVLAKHNRQRRTDLPTEE